MIAADAGRRLAGMRWAVGHFMSRMVGEIESTVEDGLAVTGRRVQLPQWLFVFLIGQAGAGIWWAATVSSDVRYLQNENGKLWQKIETLNLQREKLEGDFDSRVKATVRDQLQDGGWVRVRAKGD